MAIEIHTTDRFNIEDLVPQASVPVSHYFADTQMCLRNLVTANGVNRILILPVEDAYDRNADNVRFLCFDFAETDSKHVLREYAHLFGRFPRVVDCYKSFINMKWLPDGGEGPDFHAVRTKRGIVVLNLRQFGDLLYSPLKRLQWLENDPGDAGGWERDHVIKMLHTGQFAGVFQLRQVAAGVRSKEPFSREAFDPKELERHLVEDLGFFEMSIESPWSGNPSVRIYSTPSAKDRAAGNGSPERIFEIQPDLML